MSTNLLSRFTSYLLENHIGDFVELYLKRNTDLGLSIIKFYDARNDTELDEILKRETEIFLGLLKNELVIDINIEWLKIQQSGNGILYPAGNTISDFILMQGARKFVLIHLIPHFTKDAAEIIDIVKRIEDIFILQEMHILYHFPEKQLRLSNENLSDQSLNKIKSGEEKSWIDEIESLAHIGYCELHYTGGKVHCSEGFRRMIGVNKNTSVTIKLLQNQAIRENGFEPFSKKLSQNFKDGKPNEHEFKMRSADHGVRVLRAFDYPIKNNKKEIIGVKSFFQDITEISQTKEQTLESQLQVNKILESSPTVIWIYDLERDALIYSNWKEWALYGYKNENEFKIDFSKLLLSTTHPDDKAKIIARRKEYQNLKDDTYSSLEFRMIDSKNRTHWFVSKALAFKRKNGKVKQVLFNTVEVTELKQTEDELRKREYLLIEAQEIAHVGCYDYDNENDSVVFSSELGRIYEFPLDKKVITPADFTRRLKSDQLAKFKKDWEEINNTQVTHFESEYTIEMPDKREKHIVVRRKIIRDSSNKPKKTIGTVLDITTLKKTEEQLKFREAQLLDAQKVANVGSFEWNIKNDNFTATDEMFRIYHLPLDKKLSVELFRGFIHKDDIKNFENNLERALQTKNSFEAEYKIVLADKTVKHIFSRSKTFFNESGEPVKLVGSIMDISSLKKAEKDLKKKNEEVIEAYEKLEKAQNQLKQTNSVLEERVESRTRELKESKELYKTFIKQNSIGVWRFEFRDGHFIDTTLPCEEQIKLIDKHIYIAETNDRLVRMFGYESDKDFIGRKLLDLISIPRHKVIDIYNRAIISGYRLDEDEMEVKDVNGNTMYVQFSAIGIVNNHKFTRGWGIVRDVTDRRCAMEALKASEERYRVLTDSVPAIFWSAKVDGEVNYFNKRWHEYTGASGAEPEKLNWSAYIHPDDYKNAEEVWNNGFQTEKKFEIEYRLKRHDGKYRWHLGRALPLKGEDGKTIKWLGTSTDIEEQKHFSEILENKNKELVRLNNDLDNFISSASHDLKGPINNIDGLLTALNTELPEKCQKAEAIEDILKMMSGSVDKFKKNLYELIEVTRARQDGEEVLEENNLFDILKEVKSTIKGLIEKNNANIITDFEELSVIKFSKKNLQSIVYNLVSNAVKYHYKNRKPEIVISTKVLKDYILLSVKDNGLGFDADQIDKVFTKDNRFHKNVEGSGVGLFIIKRIIDNAGGKIKLESEKNKGSVFKVYFKKE